MKTSQLLVTISTLVLLMVLFGCGKQETEPVRKPKNQAAIGGAKATPKREAVAAQKLQNRAGVTYVVNGQEPFSGMAQDFYSTGQMKWEVEIEAGKVVALKRWHENGVLELSCRLTAGTLDDIETTAYDLLSKHHERLDGEFASYYDSGQNHSTANFNRGQAVGQLMLWFNNGNLCIKTTYENGKLTQKENYGETGWLVGHARFSGADFKTTYDHVYSLIEFPPETLDGEFVLYYPNRQMKFRCTFNKGKVIGEEQNWTPSGREIPTIIVESIGLRMIRVAPGTFLMGSPASEAGRDYDESQHSVTLTKEYWLGRTEVTQAQWERVFRKNNSSYSSSKQLPVDSVSWNDAMAFCKRVTVLERQAGRLPDGYEYTLPTEAQWEYACRAGSTGAYSGDLNAMAWYYSNSDHTTYPVGQKQMNEWGFYDMHGNVREWCLDWSGTYPGAVSDPPGPASGSYRVHRGGGWSPMMPALRSAARASDRPEHRDSDLGFRLCLAAARSSTGSKDNSGRAGDKDAMSNGNKVADLKKKADVIDATVPGAVDVPLRGHRYKVFIDDKSDKLGDGVAKIGRLLTFIPNAERGQTAIVDITHVHERWAAGDLVEVLSSVELPPKSPRATFVPTSTSIAPDLVVGAEIDVLIMEDSQKNPGRESIAKVDGLVVVVLGDFIIGERVHVRIIDRRERIAFARPTGKPSRAPNQTKINCPRCNNNAEKAPTCSLCGGLGHIWIKN